MIDETGFLMIEPKGPCTPTIRDELTAVAGQVFSLANPGRIRYRGFHRCVCGAVSDNRDWHMPDGRQTNSLVVHYISQHRAEVPEAELKKLYSYASVPPEALTPVSINPLQ